VNVPFAKAKEKRERIPEHVFLSYTFDPPTNIVRIMNKRGFFYSGVMFFYRERGDYLRLQLKHSDKIGSRNDVCYSDFSRKLSKFIRKDEKRIKKG